MNASLPHCQHQEERDPVALVGDFLADPEAEEVYFAVSKDFYEPEDQEHFETTYAAFEAAFESLAATLKQALSAPAFEGDWGSPEYPDFAVGERVVVWNEPETVYLRLHHEDRELPILIAFARAESGA